MRSRSLLILIIFAMPILLVAQDEAFYLADTVTVEGQKNVRIPTINGIAAKMPVPLHNTPASVGVVQRALFESQDGITLRDALKNVSGINVQNGFGIHDFFLVRGFESLSGGLILTDGAAEPEVSFYNLYNIEQVEVLKGPGGFLYGGNPLSGAANLVRKQPVFNNFASASGSYGRFQTFRGTFDLGLTNIGTNLAFRVNGLYQDSDNFRDDKQNTTYALNPAVTWKMNDKSSVTVNLEYVNSDYQPDSGLPLQFNPEQASGNLIQFVPALPSVPRQRSYQTPLDRSDQNLYRARVDFRREFNRNVALRNKFYLTRLDWQSRGTLLNGAFPTEFGTFNVARTFQALDDDQRLAGNQLEAIFNFTTGSVKHNLVTGFEVSRLSDDFNLQIAPIIPQLQLNLALNVDLFNPQETITDISQLTLVPFATGDGRSVVMAPYFVNQAAFSDRFQVFFGGRFDMIDYDDSRVDFNQLNPFAPIPSKTSRNYDKFSPMAGVVFSPVSALSFYANAGQSFRPPTTFTSGEPKAEESTQFEVGAKIKAFEGNLTSSLAVYNLERDNIAIPDQTGILRQTGTQRSRGIEFELAAQPLRNLHAFFNYAFTDAELKEFSELDSFTQLPQDFSGNTPAFAPKHILNLWTSKEFINGFGIGGGFRYISSQFINEDNAYKIDGYLTLDATASYTYRNLKWSVNFRNLADKEFETRGFGATAVTPGNPRAVYGSLDFSL